MAVIESSNLDLSPHDAIDGRTDLLNRQHMPGGVQAHGGAGHGAGIDAGHVALLFATEALGGAALWPLGKKDHGPDFLLTHRHLWLRSKRQVW